MKSYNVDTRAITLGLVMIGGIIAALALGRAVGNQNYLHIMVVCGFVFGCLFFFTLGDRYWYVIPFALGSGLPAIPLGGRSVSLGELAISACFAIFCTRVALKKETPVFLRSSHTPFLLFMGWVGLVFLLNPIGFLFFGAETAGARFYLKIILAFFAFITIASKKLSQNDALWIIRLVIFGSVVGAAMSIGGYFLFGGTEPSTSHGQVVTDSEGFYTWHQAMAYPAMTVATALFSRYKPSEILGVQRPAYLLIYLACILFVLASGKRVGLMAVLIAPLISSIVHKQRIYIWISSLGAAVALAVVVIGHGTLFSLPLTMQRTLSWLPASWDPELSSMAGGKDDFRAQLRKYAIENIRKNPIIGTGFAVDINDTAAAIAAAQYGGDIEIQVAAFALGRAWHNTWLGYAADFGIPLSIFQAAIFLTVLVVGYRTSQRTEYPTPLHTLANFILFGTIGAIITSHTSGHTADDAYQRWWAYGLLIAIAAQVARDKKLTYSRLVTMDRQALNKKFENRVTKDSNVEQGPSPY